MSIESGATRFAHAMLSEAGVVVRPKALQDARAAVVTLGLREHEAAASAPSEAPTDGLDSVGLEAAARELLADGMDRRMSAYARTRLTEEFLPAAITAYLAAVGAQREGSVTR